MRDPLTAPGPETMQIRRFRAWLERQEKRGGGPYNPRTVAQFISDAERVEECYDCDLDELVKDKARLDKVLGELTYTAEDGRRRVPNPSRIRICPTKPGDYSSVNDYRKAVRKYREFRDSHG